MIVVRRGPQAKSVSTRKSLFCMGLCLMTGGFALPEAEDTVSSGTPVGIGAACRALYPGAGGSDVESPSPKSASFWKVPCA